MNKRPKFTAAFKREVVDLVINQNYSIRKAAESLGISESAIRRWVKQVTSELSGKSPSQGRAITQEQIEIQALKKKI